MSIVQLGIELDTKSLIDDLQAMYDTTENEAATFIDELGNIYRTHMIETAPVITADLKNSHVVEVYISAAVLTAWVYSDVPYFDDLVKGHAVHGPIFSDTQRKWWFWYLKNVLGGEYERKTDGMTQPNPYPDVAFADAESDIDSLAELFLDKILK